MTASASKLTVFSPLEKATSSDLNRLQQHAGFGIGELARYELLTILSEEAGSETNFVSTGTPLRGLIMSGFQANPQLASTALFITGGAGWFLYPDGSPSSDDSVVKMVTDPGDSTSALQLTAGSGSTRVDVVECQPILSTIETAIRDFYDEASGVFVAKSTTKVVQLRMQYRIRTGTPGGGYPGSVTGWMPLMIATVPSTATSWNDCECWDVRPLLADRIGGVSNIRKELERFGERSLNIGNIAAATTVVRVDGVVETTFDGGATIGGWKAGGVIDPLSYPNGIKIGTAGAASDFSEGTFPADVTAGTDLMGYLYAMFPHGLPRWCRYTPSSAGSRVPGGFRGIPIATKTYPNLKGAPNVALTPPATITGLTATTTSAVYLAAFRTYLGAANKIVQNNYTKDKGWCFSDSAQTLAASAIAASTAEFTLSEISGLFPPTAREILVDFRILIVLSGAGTAGVSLGCAVGGEQTALFAAATEASAQIVGQNVLKVGGATTAYVRCQAWIPMPPAYPHLLNGSSFSNFTRKIRVSVDFTTGDAIVTGVDPGAANHTIRVLGWRE